MANVHKIALLMAVVFSSSTYAQWHAPTRFLGEVRCQIQTPEKPCELYVAPGTLSQEIFQLYFHDGSTPFAESSFNRAYVEIIGTAQTPAQGRIQLVIQSIRLALPAYKDLAKP